MRIRLLSSVALAIGAMLFLASCAGALRPVEDTAATPYSPPLAAGMARLRVARSDEVLLLPQIAGVRLDGRHLADLSAGEEQVFDVVAGNHIITIVHRSAAQPTIAHLAASSGRSYRVLLTLDPGRFPAYDGPDRPLKFIRESLDAPSDLRRPLFRVHVAAISERGAARSTARLGADELEREINRLPAATDPAR